ncbi:MAG TPA: hypothetical protein VD968_05465 [Pyrinomonadaceae bacterium]|nr:hypothetical protein [Pyrinomonadaceae bacterium]
MRDDSAITRASGGARQKDLRARFEHFRGSRRRSALGLAEVGALGAAALLLLGAVLSYLFLLVPQRSRQQSLAAERESLQRQLMGERANFTERQSTQESVREILSSLERFEMKNLGPASSGVKTVYEELNRLILKNKLRISGGINYTQLQETAPGQPAQQRGGARQQQEGGARVVESIFPGIGVTLTVEGAYANLRRFIRDIESDPRQFVVINTIELEGVTDSNSGASVASQALPGDGTTPAAPATPGVRGSTLVSLRLDMAAYFRRAASGL